MVDETRTAKVTGSGGGTMSSLLRPVGLGGLALPNRVVMAPVTRARAGNADLAPTGWHAAYYGQRAAAGLIVTEGAWVSAGAIGFVDVPGAFDAAQVEGWRRVTGVVHALGGRIVLQLWHAGAASHPDHLGGARPAGPSEVNPGLTSFTREGPKPTPTPRAMTGAEVAGAVAEFHAASVNARRAGFDGVEVHALGPSLVAQFLDPRLNLRTDAYGVHRARLLLEVVAAAAEPWGGAGVRLEAGPDTEDLVGELAGHPVSYLHLRGPDPVPGGRPDVGLFARHRRRFGGPLIANNGFDRCSGEAVVGAGAADAVSFARHFIANPDLVARFALGRDPAPGDPATYYGGGVAGYLDYPVLAWEA
ncbi:alkene reductase [Actinosynnema sp. NPDC059797]